MLKVFVFDLNKNKLKVNDQIYPTEITQDKVYWLYASNNKYPNRAIDESKCGKWMLFFHRDKIDAAWDKIKKGIQEGNLWDAKVSTRDNNKPMHAIMVYTRDYSDIQDVMRVLNYLEANGLKSAKTVIRYKTDNQTRSGIYSGGAERPWIYSSDTIHKKIADELSLKQNDQQQLSPSIEAVVSNASFAPATTSSTSRTVLNPSVPDSWEELDTEESNSQTLNPNLTEPQSDDNTLHCKK